MIQFLRRLIAPKQSRDDAGRFISQHRENVIAKAREMRAAMPDKNWKRAL